MKERLYRELGRDQRALLDAAESVMKESYSPYSKFSVGAALQTLSGRIITGTNVENAAYGSTICAERSAIVSANAEGLRLFKSVAVIGGGANFNTPEVVSPCGSCRQMLFELTDIAEDDIEVIMSNTDKSKIVVSSVRELLPLGFGPRNLGVDINRYQK